MSSRTIGLHSEASLAPHTPSTMVLRIEREHATHLRVLGPPSLFDEDETCRHHSEVMHPFAFAAVLLLSPTSRASEDPWFARDKALHFTASAVIASGGYGAGRIAFEDRTTAFAVGAGLALGAGIGKELADLAGAGHPSWRDLTWDFVGTATGLAFAWAIDRLFEWVFSEAPLAEPQ